MDYSNPDVMLPTHEKQQHNNDMWDNGVGNEALRQQVSVTKRITSLGNERLESSLGVTIPLSSPLVTFPMREVLTPLQGLRFPERGP